MTNISTDDQAIGGLGRFRREWLEPALIAIVCALIIRTFIIQPFAIPSGSMEDTLLIGDHLMVSKYEYCIRLPFRLKPLLELRAPKPGEVVVFLFPEDHETPYIKRCVAVAGQTVEIRDKTLYVDGEIQTMPAHGKHADTLIFPKGYSIPRDNLGPIVVPEGSFFALGDNRDNSKDSRFWGFVPYDHIVGRAIFTFWSWDDNATLFNNLRFNRILRPIS